MTRRGNCNRRLKRAARSSKNKAQSSREEPGFKDQGVGASRFLALLISTRLQPGVAGDKNRAAVLTALRAVPATGGKAGKPLKRLRGFVIADTRLKPGANEMGNRLHETKMRLTRYAASGDLAILRTGVVAHLRGFEISPRLFHPTLVLGPRLVLPSNCELYPLSFLLTPLGFWRSRGSARTHLRDRSCARAGRWRRAQSPSPRRRDGTRRTSRA